MSLKDAVQNAAKTAVDAVGDLAVTTTYHCFVTSSYNAVGGTVTTTFTSVSDVMVIFEGFTLIEKFTVRTAQDITDREEKKIHLPSLNIPNITPTLKDKIVTDSGENWEIAQVDSDPAQALWTFRARKV
jgi:hypothetical protein